NFFLAHDDVVGTVDLDLGAGILAHEDLVALLDVESDALPVFVLAGTHRDHLTLLRLLLGGVRNDDAPALHLGFLDAADEDSVRQWLHVHVRWLLLWNFPVLRQMGNEAAGHPYLHR